MARPSWLGIFALLAACTRGEADEMAPVDPVTGEAPTAPAPGGTAPIDETKKPVPPDTCPAESERCAVVFDMPAESEAAAELRGDFAPGAWTKGVAMTRSGARWRTTIALPPGKRVEFKLCVSPNASGTCASWRADPAQPTVAPYGNNVLASVACQDPTCIAPPDGGTDSTARFVLIGDTGKGSPSAVQVAQAISTHCLGAGCDFVALLGDNIYESGAGSPTDPIFQEKFEIPYAGVQGPVYAVLGNHDYGGNGAGNEYNRAQNEIDYTAHSTKWRMPARRYHFDQGPVSVIALDTNAQMYAWDPQQAAEVSGWIAASKQPWKIVLGHHPYKSNGPHGNAGTYDSLPADPVFGGARVKTFADQVWCGKVDVGVFGHDHSRQWLTDTCAGTELAVSGAGAAPSTLPGSNPTRYQSAELGFLYVVATKSTMSFAFINVDGTTAFTRTLSK